MSTRCSEAVIVAAVVAQCVIVQHCKCVIFSRRCSQ